MSEKKKRRHGPVPIPLDADSVSQYRRKLTFDELKDLLNDLALYAGTALPAELWDRLRCFIVSQMEVSMEELHKARHRARCDAIDKVGWEASAEEAAQHFPGISEATIRRSYDLIERSLPPERSKRPKRSKRRLPQR